MLQINVKTFASDALEDAMRLAQIKALNSFTFSDCLNNLNNIWSDVYNELARNDDGYYGKTVRLTKRLTRLPPCVKSAIKIYTAQSPMDHAKYAYRCADNIDEATSGTYSLKGTELYCWDADKRTVWLYYIPAAPQLFFTMYNRDPKIIPYNTEQLDGFAPVYNTNYKINTLELYDENDNQITTDNWSPATIKTAAKVLLRNKVPSAIVPVTDITEYIIKEPNDDGSNWQLVYISCDFPYIFCSYKNDTTEEYVSGFFDASMEWNEYNPFDFTGRRSNVEYRKCKWNDKTGLGVIIIDHSDITHNEADDTDHYIIKELGWTPDTLVTYPAPEMYRYLVARLAEILANINESNVMGVQKELTLAKYAFDSFINKNKAAWQRINNVNPSSYEDWL